PSKWGFACCEELKSFWFSTNSTTMPCSSRTKPTFSFEKNVPLSSKWINFFMKCVVVFIFSTSVGEHSFFWHRRWLLHSLHPHDDKHPSMDHCEAPAPIVL